MNRHARDEAQKRIAKTNMTNAETNAAATVAEPGATVAPEKASSKKGASQKKARPKGRNTANGGKTNAVRKKPAKAGKKANRPVRAKEANTPRAESKSAKILALIGRPKGATLVEITKAVGWQANSVRGYLSTASKKRGIKIESAKNDAGDRTYKLAN
jgi:hypothetical protein